MGYPWAEEKPQVVNEKTHTYDLKSENIRRKVRSLQKTDIMFGSETPWLGWSLKLKVYNIN